MARLYLEAARSRSFAGVDLEDRSRRSNATEGRESCSKAITRAFAASFGFSTIRRHAVSGFNLDIFSSVGVGLIWANSGPILGTVWATQGREVLTSLKVAVR